MLPIGDVIQERYQVEALLGSGGLADVYRVRHLALGSLHALKVLSWDRKSIDRRLLLEGRIQAQLRHPNIVAVTDVLKVQGKAALLLDYVDGPTLEEFMAERHEVPLPLEDALDLFAGMLAAVVRAHDAGVLHRDLKPQNVLLASEGGRLRAKVTDFGLAKVVQDEIAASNTRTNVTMGTPGYMAPEQVRDAASVDARTDVFALGVLLHELVTGGRAFVDEEGQTHVTATLERQAPPLPESTPARVREAVESALAKDPKDRPADARALAERLFAEGDPLRRDVLALSATPLALSPRQDQVAQLASMNSSNPTPASTYASQNATAVPASEPGRSRGLGGFMLLGVLALLLGLGAATSAGLWIAVSGSSSTSEDGVGNDEPRPVPSPTSLPSPTVTPEEPEATEQPVPSPELPAPPTPAPDLAPPSPVPAPPPVAPEAPAPEPAPSDVPMADPAPEPDAEPAPDDVPAPESPPEPPSGTDTDDAEAEAKARMAEMRRLLAGSWSGSTDRGQPVVLRIDRVETDGIRASLVFTGPTRRTIDLVGSYDAGRLDLSSGDGTRVEATLDGNALSGSYGKGKRTIPFTAAR